MSTVPHMPQGSDDEANFVQKVFERVWKRLQFRNSPTLSWNKTPNGIYGNVLVKGGSPPVSAVAADEFLFLAVFADYTVGQNIQTGKIIPIARPWDHRNTQNKIAHLDDGTYVYTYGQDVGGVGPKYIARKATRTLDGYFEYQRIRRQYLVAGGGNPPQLATRVLALQLPYTILTTPKPATDDNLVPAGTPVTWVEYGPPRMWCKKGDQTVP